MCFFGSFSLLGLFRPILSKLTHWDVPADIRLSAKTCSYARVLGLLTDNTTHVPLEVALQLLRLFYRSINTFFSLVEEDLLQAILLQHYDHGHEYSKDCCEIIYLVLAISSSIAKRDEPIFASFASSYFDEAMANMTMSCDHSSRSDQILMLQCTLLNCVYLMLNPSSGDVWRHLGFAIRLFFDLSHRPSKDTGNNDGLYCLLARTLYSIERSWLSY